MYEAVLSFLQDELILCGLGAYVLLKKEVVLSQEKRDWMLCSAKLLNELGMDTKGKGILKQAEEELNYAFPAIYMGKEMIKQDLIGYYGLQGMAVLLIRTEALWKAGWKLKDYFGKKVKSLYDFMM